MTTKKLRARLTDAYLDALRDFSEGETVTAWDADVRHLRAIVGRHKTTFSYFQQHRIHGKRSATVVVLGHAPVMNVARARRAAMIIAGKNAAGSLTPGRRTALRLSAAFDQYLDHLRGRAEARGKKARWAYNAKQLGDQLILPEFGTWPMADLSNNPAVVAAWHVKVTKASGPVSANRAAQVLRACYRHAARLDRSLPPALPTSGVAFNRETASQKGLPFGKFPAWAKAWAAIENPIRRAYHLTNLLCGCRPGELSRLTWADVRPRERVLVIGAAKADNDIRVPLSVPIVRALKLARDAGADGDLIFPECGQAGHRDELPARGMMLRHTFKTVAIDLGVDELLTELLMGHAPEGVSRKYVVRLILQSGPGMRSAQRRISARIVALLGREFAIK